MNAQNTNGQNTNAGASYTSTGNGNGVQNGESVTVGVGNATSGEQGATLTHETMQETGGSGGTQLTQPKDAEKAPSKPVSAEAAQRQKDAAAGTPEGAGSAATATARGYQDTRSAQASPGDTGLGTPETGGNQSERDLSPPHQYSK